MNQRNPPWVRDELLLALDLYMRYNPSRVSKRHSEVVALSKVLKKLPLHKKIPDRKHFRNPNSVFMRLKTFISCDPHTKGTGLTHANKLEKTIWKEFSRDLETLNKIAVAIRSLANSSVIKSLNKPYEEEPDCPAGRLVFRLHKKFESNRRFIQRKKKRARALKCELCGFDFEHAYGSVGRSYIELHHKVPLTKLKPRTKTRLSDLIFVCSNCHRMLHRIRPGITVQEFRKFIRL